MTIACAALMFPAQQVCHALQYFWTCSARGLATKNKVRNHPRFWGRVMQASTVARASALLLTAAVLIIVSDSKSAAQKKCVYNCTPPASSGGGGSRGGGGGSAPVDPIVNMSLREAAVDQNERGVAAMREGKLQDAFNYLERAVQMDPTDRTIRRNFEAVRAQLRGTSAAPPGSQKPQQKKSPPPRPPKVRPLPKTIEGCEKARDTSYLTCGRPNDSRYPNYNGCMRQVGRDFDACRRTVTQ